MRWLRTASSCVWIIVVVTLIHIGWNMRNHIVINPSVTVLHQWTYSNASLYRPAYLLSNRIAVPYSIKKSDLLVYRDTIHESYIGCQLAKYPMSPIVHFDLSKDPVKTNYLRKVFAHLCYFGAKAIMLQYDDSFPFSGQLNMLRSPYSYKLDDINTILADASKYKLEVIPYIQVIGQMEYVLQHDEYHDIRSDSFPRQTICPCSNRSVSVVKEIILQVMAIHKHAKAIHIGGDDFYNSRLICNRCQGENLHEDNVYIDYIRTICIFIKHHYPQINIIIWDNRLRDIPINKLKLLNNLVEPMVLSFQPDVSSIITKPYWKTYRSLFRQTWVAAAYKGAEKCDENFVPIINRLSNAITWTRVLRQLRRAGNKTGGIALMGFSRPAYSLPTCQILPYGIPSLFLTLYTIKSGEYHMYIASEVAFCTLRCNNYLQMELTEDYGIETCDRMPAKQVYRLLTILRVLKSRISNLMATLGKNRHLLGDTFYRTLLIDEVIYLRQALKSLNKEISVAFTEIYNDYTIDEWRHLHVLPLVKLINDFHWHMLHITVTS